MSDTACSYARAMQAVIALPVTATSLQVGLRHVTPLVVPREVFITQTPLACTRAESRHKNTARNVASGVHVNWTPLYTRRAVFGEENAACRATSGVRVT